MFADRSGPLGAGEHAGRGVTQGYPHVPDAALLSAADRIVARITAALDAVPRLS
jgi:hypothetical protein